MPLPLLLDDSSTKTEKPLLEKALFPNLLGEPDLDDAFGVLSRSGGP